jgi:hypothetical protein
MVGLYLLTMMIAGIIVRKYDRRQSNFRILKGPLSQR